MKPELLQVIAIILSVGATISPIIFGYMFWRMSQVFVSKAELKDLEKDFEEKHTENKEWMKSLNNNVIELLQRTAHLKRGK